jgi:NAD-dependent dihydropyrimidine dehydrogenase PreA subunit
MCTGKGSLRMTYTITSPCIDTMDQSCVDVCPVDCIHFDEGVDKMLYIDPDECIDCGACEPACPVSAIYAEDDVPDEEEAFKEINVLWYQDKDAARAKVPS